MKLYRWISVMVFSTLWVSPIKADIIWPADGNWVPLMKGTDFYSDVSGEASPAAIDLIGTADSYSAGYWALVENGYNNGLSLEQAFIVRMRLRADGVGKQYVWQTHLDTDGDPSNVEWIFQLVQSGSNNGVELIKTAVGGPTIKDIDIGSNTYSWLGDLSLYSRWTPVVGSTDYHLDLAVPWTTFSSITGVTNLTQIRAVLSTSTTHANVINGDTPLGAALTDQISNVLSESIPEPAVVTLLIGAGGGMIAYRRIFQPRVDKDDESSI